MYNGLYMCSGVREKREMKHTWLLVCVFQRWKKRKKIPMKHMYRLYMCFWGVWSECGVACMLNAYVRGQKWGGGRGQRGGVMWLAVGGLEHGWWSGTNLEKKKRKIWFWGQIIKKPYFQHPLAHFAGANTHPQQGQCGSACHITTTCDGTSFFLLAVRKEGNKFDYLP